MTKRLSGFVVVLNEDLREDDAQATLDAIRQLRGVIDVRPVEADIDMIVAASRVRSDLIEKLFAVLRPEGSR